MAKRPKIEKLTCRFLDGNLTEKQSAKLDALLLDKDNVEFFKNAVKDDFVYRTLEKDFNTEKNLLKVINEIEQTQNRKWVFPKTIYKYAAMLVLMLSVAFVWYNNNSGKNESPVLVDVPDNNIELILGDGQKQIITGNSIGDIQNGDSALVGRVSNDKLSYVDNTVETLSYNTLVVPYGKTFQIILSDGTVVELNAGTTLKYPVNFSENQPRQVYLEGEGYFDVTHNPNHKFIVNSNGFNTEVLGTEFNVTAYPEDTTTETVLVEGSVAVYNELSKDEKTVLVPNELASWNNISKTVTKTTVNTDYYTSWRQGELIFRSMAFVDIVKQLERRFDVKITGVGEQLAKEKFTARFSKEKTIDQIVSYFSESYGFTYTIDKNKINIETNKD